MYRRAFFALLAGGLCALLGTTALVAMLHGGGRAYIDFNSVGEGWPEVGLFYVVGGLAILHGLREMRGC
jgi:hypothetical protein